MGLLSGSDLEGWHSASTPSTEPKKPSLKTVVSPEALAKLVAVLGIPTEFDKPATYSVSKSFRTSFNAELSQNIPTLDERLTSDSKFVSDVADILPSNVKKRVLTGIYDRAMEAQNYRFCCDVADQLNDPHRVETAARALLKKDHREAYEFLSSRKTKFNYKHMVPEITLEAVAVAHTKGDYAFVLDHVRYVRGSYFEQKEFEQPREQWSAASQQLFWERTMITEAMEGFASQNPDAAMSYASSKSERTDGFYEDFCEKIGNAFLEKGELRKALFAVQRIQPSTRTDFTQRLVQRTAQITGVDEKTINNLYNSELFSDAAWVLRTG
ncbi:hypothetical protein HZB02_06550 [Candidatus Woesearchaeota archaeon]|nr:hypothetical protein [Candidatus Woesearchaeota archaeon]